MYTLDAQRPCVNLTFVQEYTWQHLGNALVEGANETDCALVGLSSALLNSILEPAEWLSGVEATLSPAHSSSTLVRRAHVVESPLTSLASVFAWDSYLIYRLVDAVSHRLPKWSEFRLSHFRTVRRRQLLQLWVEVQQWLTDVSVEQIQAEGGDKAAVCHKNCLPAHQQLQLCTSNKSVTQRLLASSRVTWKELFDIDPQGARRVQELSKQWHYFGNA